MSESNEERIRKLKAARQEIEDTVLVMAALESKAAARVKEHAEFMVALEMSMRSYEKRVENQEEKTKA